MKETLINKLSYYKFVGSPTPTATNDKINSNENIKEIKTSSDKGEKDQAIIKQNEQLQNTLNDAVQDLKTLSNMCNQKVIDYSDISATFKQISQITSNLALGLSVILNERGQLDPKRFKIVK